MTASPSRPLDLVLHIGSGKTGTSSIQAFMHRNRAGLAELGWLYPLAPGRKRHTRLGLFLQPDHALDSRPSWSREDFSSPDAFREEFRRELFSEIEESGLSRVVFSDEALYGCGEEPLRRLRQLVDPIARSVKLVVYLRRQDDHMVSRYQQVVKVGETRTLVERVHALDLKGTYDYYARLSAWKQRVEPAEFVVRRFERDRFVGGSLYQDFLDAVGIDARADDLTQILRANESLDAEQVEFLRILNIFRLENDAAAVLPAYNRSMMPVLQRAATGPTLTMPESFLDEFMSRWEESSRRVAVEMLGDESGELFRAPRKTANTTTEQYLDPERLDHFLTLLELPEQVHAPLRALVEREARSAPARRAMAPGQG